MQIGIIGLGKMGFKLAVNLQRNGSSRRNCSRSYHIIASFFRKNDIIINGGNSNYTDSKRRYSQLHELGIDFLDCGT
ncbi:NAD(P)-binding domain-containing protein [Flavobacterium sp. GT2P42]|uniref:NAD(P)-binding domain-containing protein n=2 Tax=unclassified Flavobacterium TaxID=196869 RepID=UPI003AAE170C